MNKHLKSADAVPEADIKPFDVLKQGTYSVIEEMYGIEFTWSEKAALSFYLDSFREMSFQQNFKGMDYMRGDAITKFMMDYFDLDTILCGSEKVVLKAPGIHEEVQLGMKLVDKEPFKEYCRRRVDLWRDERELI